VQSTDVDGGEEIHGVLTVSVRRRFAPSE
jgi:hypothetical protein